MKKILNLIKSDIVHSLFTHYSKLISIINLEKKKYSSRR
jgi:hypothetical protein